MKNYKKKKGKEKWKHWHSVKTEYIYFVIMWEWLRWKLIGGLLTSKSWEKFLRDSNSECLWKLLPVHLIGQIICTWPWSLEFVSVMIVLCIYSLFLKFACFLCAYRNVKCNHIFFPVYVYLCVWTGSCTVEEYQWYCGVN